MIEGSIGAIKRGDRLGVGYTPNGIHITKGSRIAGINATEKAGTGRGAPEKGGATPSGVQGPKKALRIARRVKTDEREFSAVDNNKDGKISPIELCVVLPNMTMDQFRQYDKNRDGHLDRAEFSQIKLP